MTLEERITQGAEQWPHKTALIATDGRCTYAQLLERARRQAEQMDVRGRFVTLHAAPTIHFVCQYLAIHLAGGVSAPVDKEIPPPTSSLLPPDAADVLLTTGTTGRQKAVLISHEALLANADNLIEAQGYHEQLTFIIAGPLNHLGCLSKLTTALCAGATVHLLPGMKDINVFLQAIAEADTPVATFLVPANIRMLLLLAKDSLGALKDKIEFIETGAAPMPKTDMQMLRNILPHSRLYNTYASSETGIVATFNYQQEADFDANCVGRPLRHSRIFLTPEGRITCQGPTLMMGYLGNEAATLQVMQSGAFMTADIGEFDARGCLHIIGRIDDIINVGGLKVSPSEVENAAMTLPIIRDCACLPQPHPLLGQTPKLLFVADEKIETKTLARHLAEKLEPHKVPTLYEQVDSIRRTFNGKIDRKRYQ